MVSLVSLFWLISSSSSWRMLFPGTTLHIHLQEKREGCRKLMCRDPKCRASLGYAACFSPLSYRLVWLLGLFVAADAVLTLPPSPLGSLRSAFAAAGPLMWALGGAEREYVCIFNVVRPAHLLLRRRRRRRRESVCSSKQAAGRKTLGMRKKKGEMQMPAAARGGGYGAIRDLYSTWSPNSV